MNDPTAAGKAHHKTGTRIVNVGRDPQAHHGFVNPPVYRGSTILFPTVAALKSGDQPYTYGRRGSPTFTALEEAIADLEGGAMTVLVPSGLSAVTSTILALIEAGDHILVSDAVYRPTRNFCEGPLKRLGIETTYYDPLIGSGIAGLIRNNTRLVFTESPGSQTFEMQDIPAIAAEARARDVLVVMDNTWASPLYFKPFDYGVDIAIQAATKYIVGHSDAMLGAITCHAELAERLRRDIQAFGNCAGTEEVYLGQRGIRTIHTRLAQHWASGLAVAEWLEARPEVSRVLHPALASHPQHDIWVRDFRGASGLFSVVLQPASDAAVAAMLDGLELFGMGYSWGGFESLVVPFDAAGYRSATEWEPEGPCLRFHIGLEDPEDLMIDLEAGFARLTATG